MIEEKQILRVYEKMQGELSQYIYTNRLLFSLTNNTMYMNNIINQSEGGYILNEELKKHANQRKVLFGAGFWGKRILQFFPNENWCCFVDNNITAGTIIDGLPVVSVNDLVRDYADSFIVISTRLYYKEIEEQLKNIGFQAINMIASGKLSDEMIGKQYFEKGIISLGEHETFVDCGAYDGTTSKIFSTLTKGKYDHIYMIEPNEAMADISKKLFMSDSNVDVIASGVWDKNTFLKLNINGSISSVNGIDIKKNESEELIENVVPAIALDELFYNSKIS